MTFLEYVEHEIGYSLPKGKLRKSINRIGTEKPKEIDGNDLAKQYYEAWKGTLHERKL